MNWFYKKILRKVPPDLSFDLRKCINCGEYLNHFYYADGEGLVRYECSVCGSIHRWDGKILEKEDNGEFRKWIKSELERAPKQKI